MSFENKNLFHLLGNDIEEETASNIPPKELVKKTTSSKKTDEAPSKADPAKAKKKSKVGGNEGAIKNQLNNRSVEGPGATPSKHYKRPFDRHSRDNKSDSGKKTKQSWGSQRGDNVLEDEVEAAEDAEAELEENDETVVDETPKKSLQDYFQELKVKQTELDGNKNVRNANEGNESKWNSDQQIVKEKEEYVAPSVEKKTKAKSQKEKKFLDFDAKFADEVPAPRESFRGGRGSSRGGRGSSRGGRGASRGGKVPIRGGKGPRGESGKLPNLTDDKKFPSL